MGTMRRKTHLQSTCGWRTKKISTDRGLITRKEGQKLRVDFDLISTLQVEEELQEQDFLDRCFQEMLDEEDQEWFIPSRDLPQAMGQLQQQLNGLSVGDGHDSEDILSKSNLNPDAKEFIPGVKY
ncbi:polyadenylate-binding protein-interacting protein 2B isoform X1 [Lutra lutra]|uniref:Polyadenylate-binding protein-interacting protein 2B isoform X1 n=1 Tax=Enhydra lutris kenyoni TaxID=391180 RepID=A0A2Y9JKI6_ENHLU|nr:polyadenylate-binding protein-interacting protein 2B isoform X1 [Enhydra lutris kenyoni]XP_032208298.1 polyadenylate-binding protein-interacting protein 2B isoform X1 [Mustela erminea]XP_032729573.1 polyadenylate-binding protein-interacting protein 2B isoform X1 [Lontra canadensis]XP_045835204.1 polyadenylate-binding protein-interacting protein 2B isoform X1 [Meles meles]XP_045835206.1 polyadenylate-binding protein-interacting protein 2B isoform X1 [Meles meles]XP_047600953.1 polyadenylate-